LPFTPRRVLFRVRLGSKLQTRFALPGYRSVNPGTETIIDKRGPGVKGKTNPFLTFNRILFVVFSFGCGERSVVCLCINHGAANLFGACHVWWNSAMLVASAPLCALALPDFSTI
jgi:hypothetical protein